MGRLKSGEIYEKTPKGAAKKKRGGGASQTCW